MQGQHQLPEVVFALGAAGGLAGLLHGGHEQADENANDGDDHQQFDEREAGAGSDRVSRDTGVNVVDRTHAESPLPSSGWESAWDLNCL